MVYSYRPVYLHVTVLSLAIIIAIFGVLGSQKVNENSSRGVDYYEMKLAQVLRCVSCT